MPVNPYDDRKVSLRRPHGNGDLDIVGASNTRRKANVTEALLTLNNYRSEAPFWLLGNGRSSVRSMRSRSQPSGI